MTLFFFSGILCCLKSRNFVEDLLAHVAVVFFGLCLKSRHFSVVTEVAQSPNHQTIWPNHTEF